MLLRNAGNGQLIPVPPAESGLVVPDDGMGLALCDLDGDALPDLAVTSNDGPLRVFRGRAARGPRLCVELRGKAGNPTAVGARARLVDAAGRVQTAEVCAGSGYLSQSAPVLFFGLGGGLPATLEVTWPDGETTRHEVEAAGVLTLRAP